MQQPKPLSIVKAEPLTITSAEPLQPPPSQAPQDDTGGLNGFAREFWKRTNPLEIIKALGAAAQDPTGTVGAMSDAQANLFHKAKDAADKGDYVKASRHFLHYMIPLLGPDLDNAGDMFDEGRYAEGLGAAVGIGMSAAGPGALAKAKSARITPALKPNAAEAEAIAFAEKNAIPVDAGTATGSQFIRHVERAAENTLGGNNVGQRARATQQNRLASVGEQLAAKGYPAAVTAEQAGTGVRDAVMGQVRKAAGEADTAYDAVRAIEADPKFRRAVPTGKDPATGQPILEEMPLPVDMRGVKAQLKPIYDRLMKTYPVAQQEASRGLKALENVVNGPDFMPLSEADFNLGAIKTISRTDIPELRTLSQGTAAQAVKAMDAAVQQTAASAGALDPLLKGRKATIAKYAAGDIYEQIRTEPVRAFTQATAAKDSAIAQLREVARLAPDEMPKIGRALLDGWLQRATSEGGFGHAAKIFSEWQNVGHETKRLLFRDPAYIRDLDNFFMFAKKAAENPNPSGSGYQASLLVQGGLLWNEPISGVGIQVSGAALSRLLWNPKAVSVLTRGLTIPLGNRAAATAATGQLMRLAREAGVPLTADGQPPDNQQQTRR